MRATAGHLDVHTRSNGRYRAAEPEHDPPCGDAFTHAQRGAVADVGTTAGDVSTATADRGADSNGAGARSLLRGG